MHPLNKNNTKPIFVEISVGELVDKITILELKAEHFVDQSRLKNVRFELTHLKQVYKQNVCLSQQLLNLTSELQSINEKLWRLENKIRHCERNSIFDSEFIEIARSIYLTNALRADVKKKINKITASRIIDEKNYDV